MDCEVGMIGLRRFSTLVFVVGKNKNRRGERLKERYNLEGLW